MIESSGSGQQDICSFPRDLQGPCRQEYYAECLLWHLLDGKYVSSQSFFFLPFFSRFYLFGVVKRAFSAACTTCVCHRVCLSPVDTLQAPAHTTSVTVSTMSLQFSANKFHLRGLKNRHLFFPSVFPACLCHRRPWRLPACLLSAFSTFVIISVLLC